MQANRWILSFSCLVPPALLALTCGGLEAQEIGGGSPASHGRVSVCAIDHWLPGAPASLVFSQLPPSTSALIVVISPASGDIPLVGFNGRMRANLFAPGGIFAFVPIITPIPSVPASLMGTTLFIQGVVVDSAGAHFTDATGIDFFSPQVIVANQGARTLSVIDAKTKAITQTISSVSTGRVLHSPDRKWAYVMPASSLTIYVYDITRSPAVRVASINRSAGFFARGVLTKDGKKMYVPAGKGIAVVDLDPASATYRKDLPQAFMPTPITGPGPGVLGSGPRALALSPDEQRLYIAYGQDGRTVSFPGKGIVGVIDLNKNPPVHRSIQITLGGNLMGAINEWRDIAISPDGRYVYAIEYGMDPNAGLGAFIKGFVKGGKLAVIDTVVPGLEKEILSIDTDGYEQLQMTMDKLGRNLWIPQLGHLGVPELLRIDVDRRSPKRNTIVGRIRLHPTNYTPKNAGPGPRGVGVTPDGSTVYVGLVQDGAAHATPQVVCVDVAAGKVVGSPITAGNTPHNISIQQTLK